MCTTEKAASEKSRIGTCKSMCPEEEIKRRTKEKLIHVLEATDESRGTRYLEPDPKRIVKEFTRSTYGSLDLSPECMRTVDALKQTTDYLIKEVLPITWQPFNVVYDFLNDRFRAIRQELTIQRIHGPDKIYMLEQMTLFHVYSSYVLCDMEYRSFDPVLNTQYLHECLNVLLSLYDEAWIDHLQNQDDSQSQPPSSNQVAFESMYQLLSLGSESALSRVFTLPKCIRESFLLSQVYSLSMNYLLGNHYRVLIGISSLPVILWMAIHGHIPEVQLKYLSILNAAYQSYPFSYLVSILCPFEELDSAIPYVYSFLDMNKFNITRNGTNGKEVKMKNKNILSVKGMKKVKWSKLDARLIKRSFQNHVDHLFQATKK